MKSDMRMFYFPIIPKTNMKKKKKKKQPKGQTEGLLNRQVTRRDAQQRVC